jgi:hypothetical protein
LSENVRRRCGKKEHHDGGREDGRGRPWPSPVPYRLDGKSFVQTREALGPIRLPGGMGTEDVETRFDPILEIQFVIVRHIV